MKHLINTASDTQVKCKTITCEAEWILINMKPVCKTTVCVCLYVHAYICECWEIVIVHTKLANHKKKFMINKQ